MDSKFAKIELHHEIFPVIFRKFSYQRCGVSLWLWLRCGCFWLGPRVTLRKFCKTKDWFTRHKDLSKVPLNVENKFMRLYLSKPFFDGHIDRGFPFGGGLLGKKWIWDLLSLCTDYKIRGKSWKDVKEILSLKILLCVPLLQSVEN